MSASAIRTFEHTIEYHGSARRTLPIRTPRPSRARMRTNTTAITLLVPAPHLLVLPFRLAAGWQLVSWSGARFVAHQARSMRHHALSNALSRLTAHDATSSPAALLRPLPALLSFSFSRIRLPPTPSSSDGRCLRRVAPRPCISLAHTIRSPDKTAFPPSRRPGGFAPPSARPRASSDPGGGADTEAQHVPQRHAPLAFCFPPN